MKFKRTGKAYQLVIRDGNDLQDALTLDEALWVAMSAPIKAYTCDPKFLGYVDTLHDGSITSSELKDAIRWLLEVYPKKEQITDCFGGALKLSDINEASANGKAIKHSAEYILKDLKGAECGDTIDLATVRRFQEILTSRPLNGDGVMTLSAATRVKDSAMVEPMTEFIRDAATATGGSVDLDGTTGVTIDQFNAFWKAIPEYLQWLEQGALPEDGTVTPIMPFGADTPALAKLLEQHQSLVDDTFRLEALQDFDQRLNGQVLERDGRPGKLDPTAWPGVESHLQCMPLVQPGNNQGIPLDHPEYVNPIYRDWWQQLTQKLLRPILGAEVSLLTPAGWQQVQQRFAQWRAYQSSIKGGICAAIPVERLKAHLQYTALPELAQDLSAKDLAVAGILKDAAKVEQLLLYLQWMIRLCNNFISFPELYEPSTPALFERGKVVIDGRWFNVTFPVDALPAHSALATQSNLFVLYVEIDTRPAPMVLAAPVTIGDKGNLAVGKRGIFFDFAGNEHNAKVVKIIENPVCLREAFVAPFVKFGKMLEDKVGKMSAASDAALQKQFSAVINDPKAAVKNAAPAAPANAPAKSGSDKGGMLMGLGVAFAALSSAFAFICKTFASMSWLSIVVSVLCVLAVLLFPIILLAIIKLGRQDLSSLLEGNGWAINSRMRLTRGQRKSFSRCGYFPKHATGTPRRRMRNLLLVLALIAALIGGAAAGYLCYVDSLGTCGGSQCTGKDTAAPTQCAAPAKPAVAPVAQPAAPAGK